MIQLTASFYILFVSNSHRMGLFSLVPGIKIVIIASGYIVDENPRHHGNNLVSYVNNWGQLVFCGNNNHHKGFHFDKVLNPIGWGQYLAAVAYAPLDFPLYVLQSSCPW